MRFAPLTIVLAAILTTPPASDPPPAYVTVTDERVALGNQFLERGLDLSGNTVRTAYHREQADGEADAGRVAGVCHPHR